ncbi:MAG: hypothetical protein UW33_C0019G0006 [candidate division WWE3 bacterium GW2011_GWF1_44_14]|nr:MAG: hypothetical protein UV03_C0028G0006 [candidate division WWE3 bacterium GW2011_GWE1_42_16]KKT43033.1 MAG: hypothetical protein UW33_C0019G0006 [candidate division WWE3 bacterium GW2011_GWF1_44_14]OGC69776.1 MAG: hypothetical protein A2380_03115 [candidate division WWE3 bacterium RIFOXYB1_FULL_43_24]OGC72152.1 MAG: hypothetical protein A2414_00390 [candidate division WWE3 bacterium RIFOXYC1_FULL_42_13]
METIYMFLLGVAAAITVVVLIKTLEPGHPELKLTSRVAFGAAFVFMLSLLLGALGIVPTGKILSYTAAFLWGIWVLEVFSPTPLLKSDKKPDLAKEEPGKRERIV